jgi:formylmethanofuran--tetrahydromethanopterin N-formyltransferase
LELGSTHIKDTFAEAFDMVFARLICTAADDYWLNAAVREFCGYSSSVIACDAETGVDRWLTSAETLDGRVGAALLVFGRDAEKLTKAVGNRVGQCLMTCPTTNVFDGLRDAEKTIPLGKHIRFFGDGFQKSKKLGDRRYWRIPVMDGEFLLDEKAGLGKGVAGGNIILQAVDVASGLQAARQAAEAIAGMSDVIAPFPGGVVRSGSKIGSVYKGLVASTSDAYCPTLRGRVESKLHRQANCAFEIVIDGTSFDAVAKAMRAALQAASQPGVVEITAGNYGGKLGKHHFHLRHLLEPSA